MVGVGGVAKNNRGVGLTERIRANQSESERVIMESQTAILLLMLSLVLAMALVQWRILEEEREMLRRVESLEKCMAMLLFRRVENLEKRVAMLSPSV